MARRKKKYARRRNGSHRKPPAKHHAMFPRYGGKRIKRRRADKLVLRKRRAYRKYRRGALARGQVPIGSRGSNPGPAIQLVKTKSGMQMLETTPRYDVILFGRKVDQLYFNMRGYVGYLPTPDGKKLDIGEHGIGVFKKEVAKLNREFKEKLADDKDRLRMHGGLSMNPRGKRGRAVKLWMRLGDSSDYEEFGNDLSAVASAMVSAGVGLIHSVRGGVSAPGFEGQNYISLYWGDDSANLVRQINGTELILLKHYMKQVNPGRRRSKNPTFSDIRAGDRVTILVPSGMGRGGQEYTRKTGRAVMPGPAGWVINLGGRYGTPGIATPENTMKVSKGRSATWL